ncbi:hypothetical protein CRUP_031564 [Coryphaenoides rupestris]|nr:hypothetical protein CRUP_031564 [Coryphaenoides rupestris]
MLTPQIGILQYVAGLVVFLLIALLIVKKSSYNIPLDVGPCSVKNCPAGMFSFSIFSGAANIVYPKICVENKLILGTIKNNAGSGINTYIKNVQETNKYEGWPEILDIEGCVPKYYE